MPDVEMKLAKSLTADTTELIPYLPYILQDLWEMGASPDNIYHLISKHVEVSEKTRVLDPACGKGAVSVHPAKAAGLKVKGIDIIPGFIDLLFVMLFQCCYQPAAITFPPPIRAFCIS